MQQLSEQNREKLDGIVQEMISNGESESNIQFVVNDFKSIYGENEETKIEPEVPTWLENTFGNDTFGVDFASDMYRAIKSGWNQSSAVGEIKDVFIGDRSDEALNDMRKALEDSKKSAVSEEMQEYQQLVEKYKKDGDSGFLAGFKALLQNPTIGPEVILSSGVGMVRTALEAPGLVAAGAATGAAAGAAGLGAGVAAGTFVGASTAAMTAMETTGTFAELLQEELKERGLDFSKNDDIRKVFEDEDAMFSIRSKALGRGIAIGAIEALTGGIASKIGARAIGGTRRAIAGAAVKGTLVEAAGGAIGETAGMLAAGQELKGEEILLEGLAGTVTAPGTIGLGYLSGKQEYSVNGKKIKGTDKNLGGTMRLGSYDAKLKENSQVRKIYKSKLIQERHRHRYEVNIAFKDKFEKKGMIFSGLSPDSKLPEIIELENHPWFIGVQFHPEFKSRPLAPHPLFSSFIKAAKIKSKN